MNIFSKTKLTFILVLSTFLFAISNSATANDYQLGMYELNRGQFKQAIVQFEPLVADGFSPAQYQLAMMYKNAQGVVKNEKKAFELLTLAANQNDSDAQFDLSIMYSEGKIVKKDLVQAFLLMEKSAKKGLASAEFNLAVMYYNGDGVIKDKSNASKWYKKAANQNYALAQFNLALMYFDGEGLEKSLEKSYIWNTIAAYNGYSDAMKSRDMDAHKMSKAQIIKAKETADALYQKIIEQTELKARLAKQKYSY